MWTPIGAGVFDEIYDKDLWEGGSGGGSTIANTVAYRAMLEGFLRDKKISSVLDVGCGDWQFSKVVA